ncbi:hypothetical protein [Candidatus Chlorohelix sp.]|uniref:hypothetical protein n=1 Tax=Candidatus Chlorohelix sp. TaxID=3139201 RepID=UPI00304556F1
MTKKPGEGEASEEYTLLLALDRLESLREDLDEVGFSTLREVEAVLSLSGRGQNGESSDLKNRLSLLEEIRDEMQDLGVDTYQEINDQINLLHSQLDSDEAD